MTGALLTTIRQQLRKRWVRVLACLGLMLVGYVASAGQIIALAYSQHVYTTLGVDPNLSFKILFFYEPLFVVAGSDYCPSVIPGYISFSIGTHKKPVAIRLNAIARQALADNRPKRALSLAKFTDKLGAKYDIFDDRPELIIAEVEHRVVRQFMPRALSTVVHWSEMTCADWERLDGEILVAQGVTYEVPDDSYWLSPESSGDEACIDVADKPLTCCVKDDTTSNSRIWDLVFRPKGPAVHLARAEGPGVVAQHVLRPEGPTVQLVVDAFNSNERPALQASRELVEGDNPARWAGLSELLAPWAGRQCFEERPDLILANLNSDQSAIDMTLRPFKVSVIDIRDEQDLPNSLPDSPDRTSLYTLRVASPELLLDESQIVQLQCAIETSAEDATNRILPVLGDRIVCQKEFPKRDDHSEILNFSLGFNR